MGTLAEDERNRGANGIFTRLTSVFSVNSEGAYIPEVPSEDKLDGSFPIVLHGETARSSVMVFSFMQKPATGKTGPAYLITINPIEHPEPEYVDLAFTITEVDIEQVIEAPEFPIRDKVGFLTELLDATRFGI